MKLVSLIELVNIVILLENCDPRNTETCEPRGTNANNETNKSSLTSESSDSIRWCKPLNSDDWKSKAGQLAQDEAHTKLGKKEIIKKVLLDGK